MKRPTRGCGCAIAVLVLLLGAGGFAVWKFGWRQNCMRRLRGKLPVQCSTRSVQAIQFSSSSHRQIRWLRQVTRQRQSCAGGLSAITSRPWINSSPRITIRSIGGGLKCSGTKGGTIIDNGVERSPPAAHSFAGETSAKVQTPPQEPAHKQRADEKRYASSRIQGRRKEERRPLRKSRVRKEVRLGWGTR